MNNPKKSITFKVLAGYLLVSAFAVFAVWIAYGQIVNIANANKIGTMSNQKLFLISEAVTNLYVAEGISREIIQNTDPDLLPEFNKEIDTIAVMIDSLKTLYTEANIRSELDSISHLLVLKGDNLEELLAIREEGATESYYARVMEKLKIEEPKNSVQNDFENLENLSPSVRELIERVNEYNQTRNLNQPKADSLFNAMKTILVNLDSEERAYQNTIDQKEAELLENDRELSNQLRNIRSEIEQEEIQKSVAQVTESQRTLEETSSLIAFVAAGAILTISIFIILIIRDTNRSQRYRQELEQSKNFAESLLKGREQMMATVTHDLRSPLNIIAGYSDLLTKTPLNDKQEHYLGQMKNSSTYILRLVNDLLDLSKLEVGKMTVEKLPFDPKSLLKDTIERSIPAENPKNIQIISNFSEDLDQQIISDPFRIQQILNNLISNAYKFTENGEIEVNGTLETDAQTIFLKVVVRDSGIGISKNQQKIIFEEFSQAENSIEKKYGGFGLGLAISKKLAELLQGFLKLESEPGKGSTFSLYVPVKIADGRKKLERQPIVAQENIQFENPAGKKVLIIDDEASQLALTSEVVRHSGLSFAVAENAIDGLKKLKKEKFDLILTDIQMPKMNGFELIRKLKKTASTSSIPVIALSGHVKIQKNTYLEKGFSNNLTKPYSPNELLKMIAGILHLEIRSGSDENKVIPETDSQNPYDLSEVKAFAQHDRAVLNGILRAFIDGNRENIHILKNFEEKQDMLRVAGAAHKMLPMFKQLKIDEIIPDLELLEQAETHHLGKTHVSLLIRKVVPKLEEVLRKLEGEITN